MRQATLSSVLSETGGRPSGFDYLRPILAVGVIANHANFICNGVTDLSFWATVAQYTTYLVVPAFFALSGFLVAGSLERCQTLVSFLGLRIFRIFPALVVEVLISAIVIGFIFTQLPISEYVRDPLFARYFLNMLGEPQYHLPGVFETHPTTLVNGQIWTIPYELVCYIVLSVIAITAIYKHSTAFIAVIVALYAVQVLNTIFRPNLSFAGPTGLLCVFCFLTGVAFFRYRTSISFNKFIFLGSVAAVVVLLALPSGIRFIALPITYITIYLGLLNPHKLNVLKAGDYSYGIYLYGFPIQQALYATADIFRTPVANAIASTLLATFVAVLSWHFVEAPTLRRKGWVYKLEQRLLASRFYRYLQVVRVKATWVPNTQKLVN